MADAQLVSHTQPENWYSQWKSCERGVIGQRARLLIERSCSGNIHMEEEKVEVKVQEEEVEDGRDK